MTVTNSVIDGARLAIFLGITLAVVNGVVARVSPTHRTLDRMVQDWMTPGSGV